MFAQRALHPLSHLFGPLYWIFFKHLKNYDHAGHGDLSTGEADAGGLKIRSTLRLRVIRGRLEDDTNKTEDDAYITLLSGKPPF